MEIIAVIILAAVLVGVVRGLQHDARAYGGGCAGLLAVVFVATVIIVVAGFLSTIP